MTCSDRIFVIDDHSMLIGKDDSGSIQSAKWANHLPAALFVLKLIDSPSSENMASDFMDISSPPLFRRSVN